MRNRRQRRADRLSRDKKSDFHIVAADRNNTLIIHATPAECLGRAHAANQKETEILGRQPPILRPRQRQVANEENLQLRIFIAQEVDASAQDGAFARDRGVAGLGSPPAIQSHADRRSVPRAMDGSEDRPAGTTQRPS